MRDLDASSPCFQEGKVDVTLGAGASGSSGGLGAVVCGGGGALATGDCGGEGGFSDAGGTVTGLDTAAFHEGRFSDGGDAACFHAGTTDFFSALRQAASVAEGEEPSFLTSSLSLESEVEIWCPFSAGLLSANDLFHNGRL